VSPAQLALRRAEACLVERLAHLEAQVAAGNEASWSAYCSTATLAAIAPVTQPGASGELLTTEQMADRLQLSPRTVRRRAQAGKLEPIRMGARGRGALRWPAR
jgi:excisionase family DNA binding protein